MNPIEQLSNMLEEAFPGDQINLTCPRGDNVHFQLVIVSGKFDGKSMVEQHQMIYQALGDAMREEVHALSIKTYTPEQWKSQGADG